MKVLQVTTNYPNKANPIFGIFMKEQVDSLEKYGVENEIFFSDGSKKGAGEKHTAHQGKWVHLRNSFKLFGKVLTHKYDLIHFHSSISGLIGLASGVVFFKKCIISFQNDPRKEMDGRCFPKLYPHFKKVIVKIPVFQEKEKIMYLPNGCNTERFAPMDRDECKKKLNLDKDKRYILFVDSNTVKKRTQKRKDRFDETLKILREKYKHENLEELVMVNVKREDVPIYMNACDMHILSSDIEGSPNSVKECMSCNVPVVATNVGNVKDLFDGVKSCKVSEANNAEELAMLADEILNYTEPIDAREALIRKGLDINSVGKKLYETYLEVLNK